jgi:predicted transcriptional regulator
MMRDQMETVNFEEIVKNIAKIVITSPQKMIREEDLLILTKNLDFEQVISAVYINLKNVGFEFIKSRFLDQNYYILTSEGKDDRVTPSQYGTLALILALSKELDENLDLNDLKDIFKEVWNTDMKFLIENDYLRKIEDQNILKITPLGKALLKNIIKDIELKNLLEAFKRKKETA